MGNVIELFLPKLHVSSLYFFPAENTRSTFLRGFDRLHKIWHDNERPERDDEHPSRKLTQYRSRNVIFNFSTSTLKNLIYIYKPESLTTCLNYEKERNKCDKKRIEVVECMFSSAVEFVGGNKLRQSKVSGDFSWPGRFLSFPSTFFFFGTLDSVCCSAVKRWNVQV